MNITLESKWYNNLLLLANFDFVLSYLVGGLRRPGESDEVDDFLKGFGFELSGSSFESLFLIYELDGKQGEEFYKY